MSNISKALVSIRFYGDDLEPEELTRLLGAQPSRANRKGQPRKSSKGKTSIARPGTWLIEYSEEPVAAGIDEQLNFLLDELTEDIATWRDLTRRFKADVFCGIFLDTWNEGFCLTESTLQRLRIELC